MTDPAEPMEDDAAPRPPAPAGDASSNGEAPTDAAFDAPVRAEPPVDDFDALIVDIDGYAGPLDVLLDLARRQKVDLRRISMLALVEQYLAFVAAARARRLELAADYLVMAAWLAYLKSRLLLPTPAVDDGEPAPGEMAARLAFQLQRLEAMRGAAEALGRLPRLGVDFLPRGAPEGVRVIRRADWRADLFDLLKAYARQRVDAVDRTYAPERPQVYRIEDARERLARILGTIPEWVELAAVAPTTEAAAPPASVLASAFTAALEFAKDGRIDLRQAEAFQPIYIRARAVSAEAFGAPGVVIAAE